VLQIARRRVVLPLAVGLSLAVLGSSASGAAPRAAAQGPLDTQADAAQAAFFENRIADFFSPTARLRKAPTPGDHGQVYNLVYQTPQRRPGQEVSTSAAGDSALYSGNYLAGQAYRFALASHRLALLKKSRGPAKDIAYWRGQQSEAKRRVDVLTRQFHILSTISKSWDYQLALKVDGHPMTPEGLADLVQGVPDIVTGLPDSITRAGFIDYGGGIIHGEPGLLFRACSRDDDPKGFTLRGGGERAFGPLRWDDGHDYYCLGGTSRDAYAGTTYGLSTALQLVGPSDPVLAKRVAGDLMALTGFAAKYLWTTPRPHGTVVLIPYSPFGHDFDHVISPLFVYVPTARLNLASVGRYAANLYGTQLEKLRFEQIYRQELASQGPQLAGSMVVDAEDPHASYYKFHLNYMNLFGIWRLDPDPLVRSLAAQATGAMQATTGDDQNALYEGIAYAMTGDRDQLAQAVRHQRAYVDYFRATERSAHSVTNSKNCGRTVVDPSTKRPYALTCVPTDETHVILTAPDGSTREVVKSGSSGTRRALTALPIALRKSADFVWQKDPTQLDGGFANPSYANPAYDYLTTYWLIRYYSEVVKPAASPFPASFAPNFQ
jgi:hypothetical protein